MVYKKLHTKTHICPDCDGTGLQKDEEGIYVQEPTKKEILEGADTSDVYCPTCKGTGYIEDTRVLVDDQNLREVQLI